MIQRDRAHRCPDSGRRSCESVAVDVVILHVSQGLTLCHSFSQSAGQAIVLGSGSWVNGWLDDWQDSALSVSFSCNGSSCKSGLWYHWLNEWLIGKDNQFQLASRSIDRENNLDCDWLDDWLRSLVSHLLLIHLNLLASLEGCVVYWLDDWLIDNGDCCLPVSPSVSW